ncbi:snRNP Sm protein [Tilletia horrida]|uniref:LSM2-LSM8 complex subunit LSM8 n=1 Tax=Tilletia horrida TaxID=155126 RepID=A0AAN6JMR5_9BASI|nr:snRNP Sm protein [Tilletia horrida]KAK0536186.1 snRNP Sm protein [Tilletia horrida]KAK0539714.1 snRNP Sm protein [Tilletia horrida]KAK0566536.1 snRNP Sm protein [Tilletia horrida]
MSGLSTFVTQKVLMVTQDGRVIVGKLEGFDSQGSIILSECIERIFSADEGVIEEPIGLYIVRGDSIALVGELDAEKDASVDWSTVQSDPMPEVRHK